MTNKKIFSRANSQIYLKMKVDIFQEHLRQARQTFNISFIALIASISISVIGAALLLAGKSTEGSVTTATGLISTTFCSQIAKESNEKLEDLTDDLEKLAEDYESQE